MIAMHNPFARYRKVQNVLRFTPPGFPCSMEVVFPGRLLPVCEKCKSNFKTREHCRSRECHTSLPWSNVFVSISLDPSCVNEENNLEPGPFIARAVPPQPYCLPEGTNPETTICAACKDKNYTRAYCRVSKKHRQLPWNTVYVVLTYDPNATVMPEYVETDSKKQNRGSKRIKVVRAIEESKVGVNALAAADATAATVADAVTDNTAPVDVEPVAVEDDRQFFQDISSSRTFLVTTSSSASTVEVRYQTTYTHTNTG